MAWASVIPEGSTLEGRLRGEAGEGGPAPMPHCEARHTLGFWRRQQLVVILLAC